MDSYHTFEDRSNYLFGRKPDIDYLLHRVQERGLTVIAGRPQIGKTWLLEQVGWLLDKQHACKVGYSESKGESDDHLLRAVMDLYRRWLASASIVAQADIIFKRHKDKLVTGVGRLFGAIFKEYAPGGGLIQKTFEGLATADHDLKTGGIWLPSLDYDSALSLTRLISEESDGKPIILILDAWEKSPTIQKVYNTLDAFLKHAGDWPHCHMLLGIRDPELHCTEESKRAYKLAVDLAHSSTLVDLKRLLPMHLKEGTERSRMLTHLRAIAPAAARMNDQGLLKIVDGFPGVIKRFREPSDEQKIHEEQGLRELAQDAQNYRYREFEKLLPSLKDDELIMAIRLAVFHRLDYSSWALFSSLLCDGIAPYTWENLKQAEVLHRHTRHTATTPGMRTRCAGLVTPR